MPTGCPEQIFNAWLPNIVAIQYLEATNKLTKDYKNSGELYLSTGYQQILARKESDGSYRLWGNRGDKNVWLTAYVAKILTHARNIISVNDKYIIDALNYLKMQQKPDGSFPETSQQSYFMKTKTQFGVPLTAFVAIAFLEQDQIIQKKFEPVIDRALNYIVRKSVEVEDNFAIAITAYAFALNRHRSTEDFLSELKANAIVHDNKMYWNREMRTVRSSESPSISVEIASYAIMAFVTANRALEAIPIVNWLITQRSSAGGFHTTTDTVVGLQALSMIATKFHTPNVNMKITFSDEKNRKSEFAINAATALTLQHKELPRDVRQLYVTASGTGIALVQISLSCNKIQLEIERRFDLTVTLQPTTLQNSLHLKVCTSFLPQYDENESHMSLIEVYLPSGFVYDPETSDMVKNVGVMVSVLFSKF